MRYLYAIVAEQSPLPERNGLGDAPLEYVQAADLTAVVSEIAAPPAMDEASLWCHEDVVEALMAEQTVLPVRFGTVLADDTAIQQVIQQRAAQFQADLVRLAGCVELSLRALWMGEEPAPATIDGNAPGRAYIAAQLATLHAQRTRREPLLALHQRLALLARAQREAPATARMIFSAAYLIAQTDVDAFRAIVAAADTLDSIRLICTGPWPPYSFVSSS